MKSLGIIAFCFLYLNLLANAEEGMDKFDLANQLYQQEEYDSAATLYQNLVDEGYESAELFYNLGNAYYQTNQIGSAVLNYRRAQVLEPYDEEIKHNLRIAKKSTIDSFETIPLPVFQSAYIHFLTALHASTWALLGVIGLFILALGTVLYLFSSYKRPGFITAAAGLLLGLLGLTMAYSNQNYQQRNTPAIIMKPSSYVKSGPGEKAEDVFILHEGAEVKVTERYGTWRKIKLPDGKVGWIAAEDLTLVLTR